MQSLNAPTSTLMPTASNQVSISPQKHLFEMRPDDLIAHAGELANALAKIIDKQKLYTLIQNRKYVTVEGWTTLGAMLGYMPREVSVIEQADKSYIATVELYSMRTGQIVGSASALCGMDEARWGKADKYARRSMAVTRATGKAYRLGCSWIMKLAGYEPTPAEEMPQDLFVEPPTRKLTDFKSPGERTFNRANENDRVKVVTYLINEGVSSVYHEKIFDELEAPGAVKLVEIVKKFKNDLAKSFEEASRE